MSIAISFEAKDTGGPILRAVMRGIRPENIGPIVGRSATNTIRTHLFGINQERPNALGGARTNYYAQAARATQFQIVGDSVIVSINQIGMAQRYYGGTIKPVTKKFLTIPARAEAHGKRAGEFKDLVVVFGRGGQPVALARAWQSKIGVNKAGKTVKRGTAGGEILFWLVKSITQKPDPTVLPYDELVETRIDQDVGSYINRIVERAGGATS